MTPLELLLDEVRHSNTLKKSIMSNVKKKSKKKMVFNVTNLIFDFKASTVEIQDELGIADERVLKISIDKFVSILSSSSREQCKE